MKGQEFATIKLVIAAAFAAALIVVVVNVAGFLSPSPNEAQDVKDMIASALSARGSCIHREVYYTKGTRLESSSFTGSTSASSVSFKVSQKYNGAFDSDSGGSYLTALYSSRIPTSVKCSQAGTCTFYIGSSDCS